jgi:hypothetical protein
MVVSGVEDTGLCLFPDKLGLLLPKPLVKAEGKLGAGSVRTHLVKVLLMSSLEFHPILVKVDPDLD